MNRRLTAAILAALAVTALLWSRQSHEPLSYYSSRSYVERANAMIARRALFYDCRDERIEINPDLATPAEQKWFAASYLENDVQLYNRNREIFGHFFIVSDCDLREINPFLRTVRLPFATSLDWLGDIEYAGSGAEATLSSSNGRTILLHKPVPGPTNREIRSRIGSTDDVAANVVHLDFAGGGQTPGIEIHAAGDNAVLEQRVKSTQAAEVRILGNAVPNGRVAGLRSGDWLHLESATPAPRSETFLFTGERIFERLSTVRTRNARRVRTLDEDEPLLGWIGGENGDEMLTFGDALARSVSNGLRQLEPARAKELTESFNLQLTINRSLQSSLHTTLGEQGRRMVNDLAAGDPFAASVTVMDAKNGEVLATASFPSDSDLESLRGTSEEERRRLLVNHNFKRHPIGSAGKPLFYAAIATKHPALLDLTIAPHGPQRRRDGSEGARETLQYFLMPDYKLWEHSDQTMDFESALERSCNKYTVDLGLLALAFPRDAADAPSSRPLAQIFTPAQGVAWPRAGTRSGVFVGGQELTFPPALGVYMKDDVKPIPRGEMTSAVLVPGTLDRINEAPFIEAFGDLAGVRTYGGLAPPDVNEEATDRLGSHALQTMQYDLRPWRPLLETLVAKQTPDTAWKVRAAFQAVSPERVNLRLNEVTDLRSDFVSLLLGGATSQWTNIQLAEAYARLVTGRQVEATLVRSLHPRDLTKPPEPVQRTFAEVPVSTAARAAVLRGMTRTTLGAQGTATAMAPAIRNLQRRYPGYHVAVFSKTGSPTVKRPESKPVGAALRAMLNRGRLFYLNGNLCVSPDGKAVVCHAKPGTAKRADFVRAVSLAARNVAPNSGERTINRITGFIDRYDLYRGQLTFGSPATVRLDPGLPMPFYVVANQLVLHRDHSIFDPLLESDSSAAYVFTLAKWRGNSTDPYPVPTPTELQAPDSRVITVVLYLDIGPGSSVAVTTARALLPKLVPLLD